MFICTHNSARSQMAEAIMRQYFGENYDVFSAGTEPRGVNPYAVEVMKEIGIDISKQRSKSLDEYKDEEFDYIITLCDESRENCPYFPGGKTYIHKSFEDPSSFEGEDKLIVFRKVRDEISKWIEDTFSSPPVP